MVICINSEKRLTVPTHVQKMTTNYKWTLVIIQGLRGNGSFSYLL